MTHESKFAAGVHDAGSWKFQEIAYILKIEHLVKKSIFKSIMLPKSVSTLSQRPSVSNRIFLFATGVIDTGGES